MLSLLLQLLSRSCYFRSRVAVTLAGKSVVGAAAVVAAVAAVVVAVTAVVVTVIAAVAAVVVHGHANANDSGEFRLHPPQVGEKKLHTHTCNSTRVCAATWHAAGSQDCRWLTTPLDAVVAVAAAVVAVVAAVVVVVVVVAAVVVAVVAIVAIVAAVVVVVAAVVAAAPGQIGARREVCSRQ